MKSWVHFLGGSMTVYLLMAACSAGSKRAGGRGEESSAAGMAAGAGGAHATGGEAMANAGTSAPNGASGEGPSGGLGGMIGGVIDDMMDPVDEADAAPATSGTRLRARYYVGEDGSKQFIGWRDKARGEDCAFQKSDDGQLRCLPQASITAVYADSGCSEPLVQQAPTTPTACGTTSVPMLAYATEYNRFICGFGQMLKVGVTVQPTEVYSSTVAGTCTKSSVLAGYAYYATTPVRATEFVAGSQEIE